MLPTWRMRTFYCRTKTNNRHGKLQRKALNGHVRKVHTDKTVVRPTRCINLTEQLQSTISRIVEDSHPRGRHPLQVLLKRQWDRASWTSTPSSADTTTPQPLKDAGTPCKDRLDCLHKIDPLSPNDPRCPIAQSILLRYSVIATQPSHTKLTAGAGTIAGRPSRQE